MSAKRMAQSRQWERLAQSTTLLDTPPIADARYLPLDRVDPNPAQARQAFDKQALAELAQSIRAHGVLEPILVRPVGDRWQVVAGERRVRAARLAALTEIPALIRTLADDEAAYITAIENLQREDLDIEDEARQFAALLELTGLSQRALAEQLGIDHEYLSRRIRLLKRPDLMAHVRAGGMTLHAALSAMVEAERLAAVVSPAETVIPEDSTSDAAPELVERAELDSRPARPAAAPQTPTPTPSPFRFRPFQRAADKLAEARGALEKLPAIAIGPEEQPLVLQQLEELEAQISRLGLRVQELREQLEAD